MSLRTVVEVALHFESFRNVDLFHQGLYHLKTRLCREDGDQRLLAIPYGYFACPTQGEQSKQKPSRTDHHHLIPAHIIEDQCTFSTRSFLIRYCEEEVELDDIGQFRIELSSDELSSCTSLILEVDLMFADLTQHGGADRFGEQPDVDSTEFKSVSTQMFRIHSVDQGLHEFCPIVFDEFHFCLANLVIHTVVMDIRLRLKPLDPVLTRPKPPHGKSGENSNGTNTQQPVPSAAAHHVALSLAEVLFRGHVGSHEQLLQQAESAYKKHLGALAVSHQRQADWFQLICSKCLTQSQRDVFGDAIEATKLRLPQGLPLHLLCGSSPPEGADQNGHGTLLSHLRARFGPNVDDRALAMHIAYDIDCVACQVLEVWNKALNIMSYACREIASLLRMSWEEKIVDQWVPAAPAVPDDPPAETLEVMLQELIAAYGAPAFQQELEELQARCLKIGSNPILHMGPVALRVQAPILEKYGYPPTPQGVDLLKHAVHRRAAEGASRVEKLANEARRLLGIEPMAEHNRCAEQVLVAKVDETNRRLGVGQGRLEAELAAQCRRKIGQERDSGLVPAASAAYLEQLLDEDTVTVAPVMSMLKMAKLGISLAGIRGDNVPGEIPVIEGISSEEFFQAHVLPNRPAVLRGVFDEESFPPMRDAADMGFLRRLCGHRRVCTKSLAHDDVAGRMVFVSDPELKLQLGAFLDAMDAYERDGTRMPFYLGKVPLRRELPELADEIERAPTCPRRKYGACFGELIPEGVFTYFGCGRNTTPVHYDGHENLLLVTSGQKRVHLYPPSDARYLYPCNDFSRSAVVPFTRFNDLEEGLREKLALVSHARPLEINLVAGDMLYLPSCWWHCVEGSKDRNMIFNWWFSLHPEKKALAHAGD